MQHNNSELQVVERFRKAIGGVDGPDLELRVGGERVYVLGNCKGCPILEREIAKQNDPVN